MILGISGVNWGDLGTFWSDFRMQNHSVSLLGWTEYPKITNEYSKRFELLSIYVFYISSQNAFQDGLHF